MDRCFRPVLGIMVLLAMLVTSISDAGILANRGGFKVPSTQLGDFDDSCRCWVLVFSGDSPGGERDRFLNESIAAYGLGKTVRFKYITPSEQPAYNDWAHWHQHRPTVITLSVDSTRVLSIVTDGGGQINNLKIPAIPFDKDQTKRRLELAKLLVLEDPQGYHGRLLNPNKPPFWLPAIRYEKWYERCPNQPNPGPAPNVNVNVQQPQMDPQLFEAITKLEDTEEATTDGMPLWLIIIIIVCCVLTIPLGYLFAKIGGGE